MNFTASLCVSGAPEFLARCIPDASSFNTRFGVADQVIHFPEAGSIARQLLRKSAGRLGDESTAAFL